jgi:hypothetical protein
MKRFIYTLAVIVALVPITARAMNIDPTNKYAWGENIGWINFGTTEGNVNVSATAMDGYAWGENVGWISLNCSNTSSCGTVNYGVTISGTSVAGYAWGENVGWISLNCSNTASCGTVNYGVTIDTATGIFSGYAWGENVGWVVFNCATTSSCGTSDYKLQTTATLATPTATPTATPPGAVVIIFPPPATVLPPPSATPTSSPGVTVTPRPSTSPRVTPTTFPTPTSTPPNVRPSVSPPIRPTTPPISERVDQLTRGLESFGAWLSSGNESLCGGPLGIASCATTAVPALALLAALLAALMQNEVAAAGFSMLQFLGLRRKPKVWGVVYDSRTKHPIALAKLELFDAAQRLLETRYADRDGRYGFLMSPATLHEQELRVQLRVSKPGFVFPSASTVLGTDYVVYDNLYHGGEIVMRGESLLNYNIPMDPIAGHRLSLMEFGQGLINPLGEKLLALGFYLGLVTVPLNWWFNPSTKNLVIAIIFIVANAIRSFALHRPHGITTDAQTGKRMSFALVVLNDLQGMRQGFAVSDEHGRFILSGEQNKDYEIIAYTPANVVPQRSVRIRVRGIRRMSTRAWITNNLRI